MSWLTLLIALVTALAARFAFLAFHFRSLESLWYDYEHRGFWFQLARGLDLLTLLVFLGCCAGALWGLEGPLARKLGTVFIAWLGYALLTRLGVHRFPRTNVSGALSEAKLDLFVHVLMSFLGAAGATAIAGLYFGWRG